jgi:hypothetical protein
VLLGLIGVHVGAVLYYLIYKSENLIKPMFTGRKHLPAGAAPATMRGVGLAIVLLAFCAASVWALINS